MKYDAHIHNVSIYMYIAQNIQTWVITPFCVSLIAVVLDLFPIELHSLTSKIIMHNLKMS